MYVVAMLLVGDDGTDYGRATLHGDVSGQSFIALGRLPEGSIDYPWHTERETTMQASYILDRQTTNDNEQVYPDSVRSKTRPRCGAPQHDHKVTSPCLPSVPPKDSTRSGAIKRNGT